MRLPNGASFFLEALSVVVETLSCEEVGEENIPKWSQKWTALCYFAGGSP
jgi:hypothetical protein